MLEKFARDAPGGGRRGPGEPRAVHLGATTREPATRRRSRRSTGRSPGSPRRPREAVAFGGAARAERRARTSGARGAARLMPAIRGLIGDGDRKVGHFDDSPAVLEFVNSQRLSELARARHLVPRPFPAHQDPAAGRRLHRRRDSRLEAGDRRLPRRLRRLLRALPASRQPRRCAIRTRSSISSPASA